MLKIDRPTDKYWSYALLCKYLQVTKSQRGTWQVICSHFIGIQVHLLVFHICEGVDVFFFSLGQIPYSPQNRKFPLDRVRHWAWCEPLSDPCCRPETPTYWLVHRWSWRCFSKDRGCLSLSSSAPWSQRLSNDNPSASVSLHFTLQNKQWRSLATLTTTSEYHFLDSTYVTFTWQPSAAIFMPFKALFKTSHALMLHNVCRCLEKDVPNKVANEVDSLMFRLLPVLLQVWCNSRAASPPSPLTNQICAYKGIPSDASV